MADWLNIAGGAGAGFVAGTEDNRRREEFNSLMRQRQRIEKQQKEDEAIEAGLKGVRPAGDYDEVTYGAGTSDPAQLGAGDAAPARSTTKKVKRTAADAAREQAAVLEGSGSLRHMQTAAGLRQNALATEAGERTERLAKGQEALMQAGQLKAMGNLYGSARILADAYKKYVPDGHELMIEQGQDGSLSWGVVGPDGTWVQPPEKITAESLQKRIDQGVSMLTPELMYKEKEYGLKKEDTASHRITADAATQQAATAAAKHVYETTGDYAASMIAYRRALANQANAHAAYLADKGEGAGATTYGTPIEMVNEAGEPAYGIPTKKGAGPPGIEPAQVPKGWTFPGTKKQMNDVQSKGFDILRDMEKAGAFEGKGGREKRDDVIAQYNLEKFVKLDPVTQKIIDAAGKGPPPAPTTKAAPVAAPAKAAPLTPDQAAEQKASNAEKALQKFGLRQRKDNPAGYAAALKARDAAKAELDALNAKYAETQPTGAAFRSAAP